MGKLYIDAPKSIIDKFLNPFTKCDFYVVIDGVDYPLSNKNHGKSINVPDGVHKVIYMDTKGYENFMVNILPDDDPRKIKYLKYNKASATALNMSKNIAMNLAGGGISSALVGMAYDKTAEAKKNFIYESHELDFTGNKSYTLKVKIKKGKTVKSMSLA